jgi:hypothetical protein
MREELEAWQKETGDLGLVEERGIKLTHYPDGEKPECKEASCLVFAAESYGQERAPDAFSVPQQHRLQLFSGIPGSSISYSLEAGEKSFWRVYTSPLILPVGNHQLRTVVPRIGYQHSNGVGVKCQSKSCRLAARLKIYSGTLLRPEWHLLKLLRVAEVKHMLSCFVSWFPE